MVCTSVCLSAPAVQLCSSMVSIYMCIFFRYCWTCTKRYIITPQTRVKRVGQIHQRTIKTFRVGDPQSPFSISFSFILFFLLLLKNRNLHAQAKASSFLISVFRTTREMYWKPPEVRVMLDHWLLQRLSLLSIPRARQCWCTPKPKSSQHSKFVLVLKVFSSFVWGGFVWIWLLRLNTDEKKRNRYQCIKIVPSLAVKRSRGHDDSETFFVEHHAYRRVSHNVVTMETSAIGWPPWLIVLWYLLIWRNH